MDETQDRAAFTIAEFCRRNGFSKPAYFKLRNQGLGPAELRCGGIVRITHEAEIAWQRARTHRIGAEAESTEADAEARRTRAKAAATSAIASEKHISKRRQRENAAA